MCAQWMRYLGAADTMIADPAAVIPCDLFSSRYLGWVDNNRGNVGQELVDRAASVIRVDGRAGLIFFRSGFSPYARESATAFGIALLRFAPENAHINGHNEHGHNVVARGLA
jgi:hypothetical protein